jgi:hypothetical protein
VIFGKKVLASEEWSGKTRFGKTVASCPGASEVRNKEKEEEEVDTLVAFLRDQAERSLA